MIIFFHNEQFIEEAIKEFRGFEATLLLEIGDLISNSFYLPKYTFQYTNFLVNVLVNADLFYANFTNMTFQKEPRYMCYVLNLDSFTYTYIKLTIVDHIFT